jgi:lysyl endopeptidase
MRRLILLSLILLLIPEISFSQLSKGGQPYSSINQRTFDAPLELMPSFDINKMLKEDENKGKSGPYRFGRNFDVNLSLSNSGKWFDLENGDRIWLLEIKSSGAFSLNFIFKDFFIPKGGKLFIYNQNKTHVAGAFGDHNNNANRVFATDLIKGEHIILEYYEPAKTQNPGSFTISTVTHAYRDVVNGFSKSFGESGACNINVNCPLGLDWENQKRSVVMLVVGGNGFCTGSLINNTAEDGTPYLLTADHCGSTGIESWVFRFNWEAPNCPNPSTSPPFVSLTGATLRANNPNSDFMLLELNEPVPLNYNPFYAGWNRSDNSVSTSVTIHHPNGDIKKISASSQDLVKEDISGIECWVVESWDEGTTEPGSSGSPLFDEDKRIIGQLYGGYAACDNNLEDFYGRFAASWDGPSRQQRLRDWLDNNNSNVPFLNGFDPALSLVNNDAGIAAILFPEESSEICINQITPRVVVRNYGKDTLKNVTIKYQINNAEIVSQNWSGSLATGFNQTISLEGLTLDTGNYSINVFTALPNNVQDQNTQNDSKSVMFNVIIAPDGKLVQSKVIEDFEGLVFPPENWTKTANQEFGWKLRAGVSSFGTGNASAFANNYDNTIINQRSQLITESFNIMELSQPLSLNFDLAHARYSSNRFDSLIVSISDDCGATWKRIYAKGGPGLSTVGSIFIANPFVPNASQWRTEALDISQFSNSNQIIINFENVNGWGNNIYIDNITISDPTSIYALSGQEKIAIYPNPFQNLINIAASNDRISEIIISDFSGKRVFATTFDDETDFVRLDQLSALPSGIYITEVRGKNSVNRIKLVKAE